MGQQNPARCSGSEGKFLSPLLFLVSPKYPCHKATLLHSLPLHPFTKCLSTLNLKISHKIHCNLILIYNLKFNGWLSNEFNKQKVEILLFSRNKVKSRTQWSNPKMPIGLKCITFVVLSLYTYILKYSAIIMLCTVCRSHLKNSTI